MLNAATRQDLFITNKTIIKIKLFMRQNRDLLVLGPNFIGFKKRVVINVRYDNRKNVAMITKHSIIQSNDRVHERFACPSKYKIDCFVN